MDDRKEVCKFCKFYFREDDEGGQCRRYAPRKIHGVGSGYEDGKWSEVAWFSWCGEWQPGATAGQKEGER